MKPHPDAQPDARPTATDTAPPPRHQPMAVLALGSVLITLWTAACAAHAPDVVEGLRAVIRATARSSLICFCLAYAAHAVVTLRPSGASRWLLRHRRQWGWLLLVSHGVHALAIVGLWQWAPALLNDLSPPSERWGPAVAYLVVLLMGLTSFDRSAVWFGATAWRHLHTWGSHYLWLSFMVANAKRVPAQHLYLVPVALLCGTAALRACARWQTRKQLVSARRRM